MFANEQTLAHAPIKFRDPDTNTSTRVLFMTPANRRRQIALPQFKKISRRDHVLTAVEAGLPCRH
jgi:hypothetical protein